MHRRGTRLLLTLAVTLTLQPMAARASVVCENLRLQLASQPEVVADTSEMRRYASAIARQNIEIRKARYDMRRLRCDGAIVEYRADGTSQCRQLSAALTRMESNKRMLSDKRDALRHGGAGINPVRERLLPALEANHCNETDQPEAPAPSPHSFSRLGAAPGNYAEGDQSGLFQAYARHGSLRTLCVRTCDGAFFPISSNTSPLNFRRDIQICEQMCPDTETELYYHAMRTEESADMVSAETGRPYRMLPTAFAYLSRPSGEDPSCGCDLAAYHRRMQNQGVQGRSVRGNDKAVLEIGPSSSNNSTPDQYSPPAASQPPERIYDPQAASVRQVGPTFLPTTTNNIDLRKPALPGPQPIQQ